MDNEIEFERENDGRWIAEIPAVFGAMAYGTTEIEAESKARAIADNVIASSRQTP
jgi:predicted RNase H-like HicB family nuclease